MSASPAPAQPARVARHGRRGRDRAVLSREPFSVLCGPYGARVRRSDVRLHITPYDYAAAERLLRRAGRLARDRPGAGPARASATRGRAGVPRRGRPPSARRVRRAARGRERILDHVGRGSRITVHGDYDVDGVGATAVLVRALRTLGADVDWYLPSRIDDGYGLALRDGRAARRPRHRLLVTVDCAITAVDEVAAARAAGLDVVVTDHHAPRADGRAARRADRAPAARRLPVPGAVRGRAWRTCSPARCSRAPGWTRAAADADLDLVALATVADASRSWARTAGSCARACARSPSTRKPGLQALMEVSRVDPSGVDAGAIGFRLAPRINAAGRLHRADAGSSCC